VLIEICVTHQCDESKKLEYRRQAQNVIEVLLPKGLLVGVDVLNVDFVRQAITQAEKRCLSFNPLSEFCKSLYQLNADVIKEQGSRLRALRKDIAAESKRKRILNSKIFELQKVSNSWSEKAKQIDSQAQNYAKQLNAEIHAQNHVKQYLSDKDKYESLIADVQRDYLRAREKAESDIAEFEDELKQDVRNRIESSELHRRKSLQDELLEFSGGTLLDVEQYIQKINELYENRFDELERNWTVLESKLARFNQVDRKPEFVNPGNRKLPPLNLYNKVRG
jgi:chromosome segregation ATPase